MVSMSSVVEARVGGDQGVGRLRVGTGAALVLGDPGADAVHGEVVVVVVPLVRLVDTSTQSARGTSGPLWTVPSSSRSTTRLTIGR